MNILDAFRMRGIPFKEGSGGEVTICCPFCLDNGELTPDTRFRLGFNLVTGKGRCFNCTWRSKRSTKVLGKALELGEFEDVVEREQTKEKAPTVLLPDDFELIKPTSVGLVKKAYTYLRERGVTDEQLLKHRPGVSLSSRYAYRIVFPIRYDKKLLGIVSRDFTGTLEPKYLNSKGMKGIFNCPVKKYNHIAQLTEGLFDALSLERAFKKKDSLAILGHSVTDEQEEMLRGYEELILWPDNDRAGINGMIKTAQKLANSFRLKVVMPAGLKDAGGMSVEEVRSRVPVKWNIETELQLQALVVLAED